MKSNSNPTPFIIAAIVIIIGAYWYYSTQTGNQPPLTTGTEGNPLQMRFKTLVGELKSISFDTSIFAESRFTSLVDLATPVSPEMPGRSDPFAPIPGISEK